MWVLTAPWLCQSPGDTSPFSALEQKEELMRVHEQPEGLLGLFYGGGGVKN